MLMKYVHVSLRLTCTCVDLYLVTIVLLLTTSTTCMYLAIGMYSVDRQLKKLISCLSDDTDQTATI